MWCKQSRDINAWFCQLWNCWWVCCDWVRAFNVIMFGALWAGARIRNDKKIISEIYVSLKDIFNRFSFLSPWWFAIDWHECNWNTQVKHIVFFFLCSRHSEGKCSIIFFHDKQLSPLFSSIECGIRPRGRYMNILENVEKLIDFGIKLSLISGDVEKITEINEMELRFCDVLSC